MKNNVSPLTCNNLKNQMTFSLFLGVVIPGGSWGVTPCVILGTICCQLFNWELQYTKHAFQLFDVFLLPPSPNDSFYD